jgi:hypothetical protein
MIVCRVGTGFGNWKSNKMKLSSRDIVLLIGIAVAVVVTLTTLVYKDRQKTVHRTETVAPKKTSAGKVAAEVLKHVIGKTNAKL